MQYLITFKTAGARFLQALARQWDLLNGRERVLMLMVIAALAHLLVDKWLLTPLRANERELVTQQTAATQALSALAAQVAEVKPMDPTQQQSLQDQVLALEHRLKALQGIREVVQVDAPDVAGWAQRALLHQTVGVKTLGVKTSEAKPLLVRPSAKKGKTTANSGSRLGPLMRHSVEVSLQGSYLALLTHLEFLESLDRRALWTSAALTPAGASGANMRVFVTFLSQP